MKMGNVFYSAQLAISNILTVSYRLSASGGLSWQWTLSWLLLTTPLVHGSKTQRKYHDNKAVFKASII